MKTIKNIFTFIHAFIVVKIFRAFTLDNAKQIAQVNYIKGVKDAINNVKTLLDEQYGADKQEWIDNVYNGINSIKEQLDKEYEGL